MGEEYAQARPGTIGDWDATQLIKFVKDILDQEPSQNFQSVTADLVVATKELVINRSLTFPAKTLQVGNVGAPAFTSTYKHYASGFRVVSFWRDPMDIVHLRGLIGTTGAPSTATVFTLPPGYRPDQQEIFSVVINNGAYQDGRLDIANDGQVVIVNPGFGTLIAGSFVSLSGITFRAPN